MKFNPTDETESMVAEMNDTCGCDNNSYPLTAKARRLNSSMDMFYLLVFKFLGWTIDESRTDAITGEQDFNIATSNLHAGQQDIPFPTELFSLISVYAKANNGSYKELTEEVDPRNTLTVPSGHSGTPTKFRLIGNSILLDFIPNEEVADGLKIHFVRKAIRLAATDTDKEPGVPSVFHMWLCHHASLPYLITYQKASKNDYSSLIEEGKMLIKDYMANRNQTRRSRLGILSEDNR